MKVCIDSNLYEMNEKQLDGVLQVACSFVPQGIYAIIKGDYCELRCDFCDTEFKLKKRVKELEKDGFTVRWNKLKSVNL